MPITSEDLWRTMNSHIQSNQAELLEVILLHGFFDSIMNNITAITIKPTI